MEGFISWSPPPEPWIKLNIDGCSKGNPGPAGIGGVFRDHRGAWLCGFASRIRPCSSCMAEWTALRVGLSLAWDRGFRQLLCETDASFVVTGFSDDAAPVTDPACAAVIAECKELLQRDWTCSVVHTRREGNACADVLSKVALSLDPRAVHVFLAPPPLFPLLSDALIRDQMGVAVPRGFRVPVVAFPRPPCPVFVRNFLPCF